MDKNVYAGGLCRALSEERVQVRQGGQIVTDQKARGKKCRGNSMSKGLEIINTGVCMASCKPQWDHW